MILAAGASTRFGSPKQLAKFEGRTLIERICDTALSTEFETVVVLGSEADEVRKVISVKPVEIAFNEDWQEGLSTSIKTGLRKLLELDADLPAVILTLADQPFITNKTFLKLVNKWIETGKPIVASAYSDTLGTPALFARDCFDSLQELSGDTGAKTLINERTQNNLTYISAPEAETDIDTLEDLRFIP